MIVARVEWVRALDAASFHRVVPAILVVRSDEGRLTFPSDVEIYFFVRILIEVKKYGEKEVYQSCSTYFVHLIITQNAHCIVHSLSVNHNLSFIDTRLYLVYMY